MTTTHYEIRYDEADAKALTRLYYWQYDEDMYIAMKYTRIKPTKGDEEIHAEVVHVTGAERSAQIANATQL